MPLYVYALSDAAAAPFAHRGRTIEFIDIDGVFAAATPLDARPPLNEEALRDQHEIVAAIAERVDAVVPARFGSLVDRAELARLVGLRRDVITAAFALVRGREQMTMRIFGLAQSEPVTQTKAATGTEYLQQRKAAGEWSLPARIDDVRAVIRHLVVAERMVRGEGRVQGTLYHLIARGAGVEYSQHLEDARPRFADVPYIVSGPWPPFAFAPELWT